MPPSYHEVFNSLIGYVIPKGVTFVSEPYFGGWRCCPYVDGKEWGHTYGRTQVDAERAMLDRFPENEDDLVLARRHAALVGDTFEEPTDYLARRRPIQLPFDVNDV